MNGTRQFWIVLGAMVLLIVALAGLYLSQMGCQAVIPTEVSPDVTAAVGVAVDQSRREIENDLWAVFAILLGVIVSGGLILVLLGWLVVRGYSYLRQKPKWEKQKDKP